MREGVESGTEGEQKPLLGRCPQCHRSGGVTGAEWIPDEPLDPRLACDVWHYRCESCLGNWFGLPPAGEVLSPPAGIDLRDVLFKPPDVWFLSAALAANISHCLIEIDRPQKLVVVLGSGTQGALAKGDGQRFFRLPIKLLLPLMLQSVEKF